MIIRRKHLLIMQEVSHKVWEFYSDEHGYRSEKQKRNADASARNPDDIWFFWNQFDFDNHIKVFKELLLFYKDSPERNDLIEWTIKQLVKEKKTIIELKKKGIEF